MKYMNRTFVRVKSELDERIYYDSAFTFIHTHWYIYKHREIGIPDTLDLLAVL